MITFKLWKSMVAVVLGTGLVSRHLAGLAAFTDSSQAV